MLNRLSGRALLLAFTFAPHALSAARAPSTTCQFQSANGLWTGSCGVLFAEHRTLTIAPAKSITTGVWQKGATPTAVWSGQMTDSASSPYAVEVEIYSGGSGIVRTEFGWYAVSGFALSPTDLRFQIDTSREIIPNELDRQILRRAATILSSASTWNRADNRRCPPTATTWSIYCALERATIEVTGGFHHRRPALEVVRQIVEERTAGRNYNHRLMDYNNDSTTSLNDVQSLFAEALKRAGS
jgi:hypothetical protein